MSEQFRTCEEILAQMPEAILAIRRTAFRSLASGVALSIDEAAAIAGIDIGAARKATNLVASVGMAEIQDSKIIGMDGLTSRETQHRLMLGEIARWTWCAYDIVGIAAALDADALGKTSCGACGKEIEIVVRQGRPEASEAVGWLPGADCSNVMAEFCPSALLFCSREHLNEWRSTLEGSSGEALGLDALAERGRIGWHDLVA